MFPKFLGIGAQKAGTTWLHKMLSKHREIWLPRLKELHYFDRRFPIGDQEPRTGVDSTRGILLRRLSTRLRRMSLTTLGDHLQDLKWRDLTWELRYHFGRWNDEWYSSLFENSRGRLAGEITPAYSCLGDAAISHIRSLMPDAKLILLLRDPVERAWSHARMDLAHFSGKRVEAIDEPHFVNHFLSAASRHRGGYPRMIDRWLSHFPERQIFIGYYDEIESCPEQLLTRILQFLGVSATLDDIPGTIRDRINVGAEAPIPDALERQLALLYIEDLRELAARYDSYPRKWLERYERVLHISTATT